MLRAVVYHWLQRSKEQLELKHKGNKLRPDNVNLAEADLVLVPQASVDLPDS